ncbi:hypothetical protein [Xanthomonas albilineans]|uniref:hypothetical protein n=1 Tax=Xanthomonas albilineans TaxID=29447 RepID=UPI000A95037C|nr:hypothetical protein [Xanthomonas albilineans]
MVTVLLVAGAGAVLAFMPGLLPSQSSGPIPLNLPHHVYTGNPLLSATKPELKRWMLASGQSCVAEVYVADDSWSRNSCITYIIDRVHEDTGITLSSSEVTDPAVRAHVRKMFGAQGN